MKKKAQKKKKDWQESMQVAASHGFYNKGIKDPKFIENICKTNKEVKDADKKIHELKVQGLSKN